MNMTKLLPFVVIIAVIVLLLSSSAFIVNEAEQVIITQFGKPVGDPIKEPGIHFKIPWVQKVNFFDKRFLEWDGSPNQVPTKDKRFIWVDSYARWRISDPLLFFQRVRDERGAQTRLDDIIDGGIRNAIANNNLVEVVRSSNRTPSANEDLTEGEESTVFLNIEFGQEKLTRSIIEAAAPRTAELGIELLDVRFKRINYVEEVRRKIFERMISERKRIAEKFRSEGQGKASKILGDKERELKKIQSGAYREAQEIKGKADAQAAAIYAKAYNQSAASRDFFKFIKTMETYKTALSEKDFLLLSTESDFFKYLRKQK